MEILFGLIGVVFAGLIAYTAVAIFVKLLVIALDLEQYKK